MASCGNPTRRDNDPMEVESETDDDELEGTYNDEAETPISGKTGKKKGKESEGVKARNKERSYVWQHFTRVENKKNKCSCNYCGRELGCATKSGTSTLRKHVEKICKAYKVWLSANKDNVQSVITFAGVGGNIRVSKVSEALFREATNEMLILAELPLAFVESLAWRHFCSKVQLYKPHSRRTATRDIVEIYVKKKALMKKIIEHNKQRLSLTTDIWIAPTIGASYMVITAHFVDDMWRLRKMIIGFKNVSDHKGGTISNCLIECLEEWGIQRIFCITVDNATANSSAMTKFKTAMMDKYGSDALILKGEYLHLRCAAHILNLVVKEGLHEINSSVEAIRNGIHYARSSSNRLKAFDFRVESGKLRRGSLPLDVKTRWNSTYLMIEQALKFKVAFERMEAEDKPYNDHFQEKVDGHKRVGPTLKSDLDSVERFAQILGIFYKSTLVLSASTTVAAHKLYNEIISVMRNITILGTTGDDDDMHKKVTAMLTKLEKYWNPFGDKVEMNRLVMVASVFDPRKKMKFIELCFDRLYGKSSVESTHLSDSMKNILKDLYDEYTRASLLNKSSDGSSSQSQSWSAAQDQFDSDMNERQAPVGYEDMAEIFDDMVKETGIHTSSNELDMYLKEDVETSNILKGSEYDLLLWWRVNSGKYPVLSLIAKDILAMQVFSVTSEFAFSTSGRVLDPSRSCLTHYMIEVLMCTEQWLKCEIHINDKGVSTIQQLLSEIELQDDLMREFEPDFKV